MSDDFKTIRIRTSDYRRLRRIAASTDEKLSEVVGRLLKDEATRLGIQEKGEEESPPKTK